MLDGVTRFQYLSLTAFFLYKMLREEESKLYHKTSAVYLFICYSALCAAEGPTESNKSAGSSTDGGTAKQKPACHKEQDINRVGWDFPGGDATAWGRALWLLLRQSADVSMRRNGQALWSAITCRPRPRLGQDGYVNFMVVPGLTIYGPGSIIFRGTS